MKKHWLHWLFFTLFLINCSSPYQQIVDKASATLTDTWYYAITNGVFLGGSLL